MTMRHVIRSTTLGVLMVSACTGCRGSEPPLAGSPVDHSPARRVVVPPGMPDGRPYSYAVRVGDSMFLAGQLGQDPTTGVLPEGIDAQTRQAMENIGTILAADGLEHAHLVKCHVYLADMDDYAGMNAAYGSYFSDRVPARTTVEAAAVPGGSLVEIGCIAHADLAAIAVVRPPDGALPAPLGPYSAGVWAGDTLFLSGMGGQNPADRAVPAGVPAQVTQTLANIGTTLAAAGLGFDHVVAASIYYTTRDEMDGVPEAFAAPFVPGPVPDVSRVFLPRLPGPIKVEVTFVAARTPGDRLFVPATAAPGADISAQARGVFAALQSRVERAGLVWGDVASVQVYLADLADMPAMDTVFREVFPHGPPARTTIQAHMAGDTRVEIALVADR